MKNKEINSMFEDWLSSPMESPDFEVKDWLDLDDRNHQGLLAKALIALENHGGGFLLVGFTETEDKKLVPNINTAVDKTLYTTDTINGIVDYYASPSFHVGVYPQEVNVAGVAHIFPLIHVEGNSDIPVCTSRDTPNQKVKKLSYFVRRAGPKSEIPQNGYDWDKLLSKCMEKRKEEIINLMRSYGAVPTVSSNSELDELKAVEDFYNHCMKYWSEQNTSLPEGHTGKISLGYFAFTAKIHGTTTNTPSVTQLKTYVESANRYTGWPIFVAVGREGVAPYAKDGALEAWLKDSNLGGPAHSDFWRITPKGDFFILRGYQEDGFADTPPGKYLDPSIPLWRLGEFLLRLVQVAEHFFEEGFKVSVRCEWTGLKGRETRSFNFGNFFDTRPSTGDSVTSQGQFTQDEIQGLLPEVVSKLAAPLYEHFSFFHMPLETVANQITQLKRRR